jgi:hypothetical protein
MKDYEKSFVDKVSRFTASGIDFEVLAREAIIEKFGGAAGALFSDLRNGILKEPGLFAQEFSRKFGRGAIGFLEPIVKYAESGRYYENHADRSNLLEIIHQIGPPGSQSEWQRKTQLHDHRIKDEQENYAEDAN